MGSGSSKSIHREDTEDGYDPDNMLSEASLAKRAEEIRLEKFPIDFPIDEAIAFGYTAFISLGALLTPTAED